MSYFGEFPAGSVIDFHFTTRRFSTGAPFTLAGTPAVRVYKANGTTEGHSGITLTADFDSRTGLNQVNIDTSSDATFYATDQQFSVVITAGTVDSVSVVGEVVGRFVLRAARASQASVDTIDDFLDTEIAAIKTKTDNLPSDPADASDVAALITAVDDFVDTEVAAIKAKTDLIPGTQDGLTWAQSVLLGQAVLLGKASGLGTTTAVYRSTDDGEDRVTATVDTDGNRTAVTLNTA